MSHRRVRHPSELIKVGDLVDVKIVKIDKQTGKLSLSLKQAGPDPWSQVKEKYAVDMAVKGKVTRVVDFGAFVELEPGLEGLVHISELAPHRVKSASDVVKTGQEVDVRVLEIDKDARRIALSIRRAAEPVAPVAAPVQTQPGKKKKKPELRGGLDWNW
jgi:ribosomal protein S1